MNFFYFCYINNDDGYEIYYIINLYNFIYDLNVCISMNHSFALIKIIKKFLFNL